MFLYGCHFVSLYCTKILPKQQLHIFPSSVATPHFRTFKGNWHYWCLTLEYHTLPIIIIIIIISIIISFMQGSHIHIPETNHVPRGYIVAAILSLLFVVPLCLVPVLVLLFFYVSTF